MNSCFSDSQLACLSIKHPFTHKHIFTHTPLLKILSCGRKGSEDYMQRDIQIAYLLGSCLMAPLEHGTARPMVLGRHYSSALLGTGDQARQTLLQKQLLEAPETPSILATCVRALPLAIHSSQYPSIGCGFAILCPTQWVYLFPHSFYGNLLRLSESSLGKIQGRMGGWNRCIF